MLGDVEIMLIKIFTDENYLENPHNIETIILSKTKLEILGLHFDCGIWILPLFNAFKIVAKSKLVKFLGSKAIEYS